MKVLTSLLLILSFLQSGFVTAATVPEDIHENDFLWLNFHLYHGEDQRGGPFKFNDQYLEIEFGGRSGLFDLYGYVDFKDAFNNSDSDAHDGSNMFADIEPRMSLDYLFDKDLSVGIIKEWYIAMDIYYGDNECAQTCVVDVVDEVPVTTESSGLKIVWLGIGTDMELPWLGKTGVNLYARLIRENYGATNEDEWDGYAFHMNWFKTLHNFENSGFLAFQGYFDYEFGSDLDEGNSFEQEYRTDTSLQSYLGIWYHLPSSHFAMGYGLKLYDDMTQWKDGTILGGKEVDTSGAGHYFNLTYSF
ncbi:outer membrane protein OmpK [Thalassotalea psychrophila]|uniref:Outer membrane protein OmpK n=1 Tax=Thalassotalea psychrophila TaxID=3065647 RepID=A0ABY9TV35_9GAMM|nr:outer membrane protein OmpK [Colwelliaceae bacterium SQ149]